MKLVTTCLAALALLLVLSVPNARAATDEQRLEANITGVIAAWPSCGRPVIHLHADAAIHAAYPDDVVRGMSQHCEVWLSSAMPLWMFRGTLYHEAYHATHCACEADHGRAMDRAVLDAMGGEPVKATRSRYVHELSARRAFRRSQARVRKRELRAVRLALRLARVR